MRLAPGLGIDAQELDPRLSETSLQAVRDARAGERNILSYYLHFLAQALRGEFGVSTSLGRPVGELLGERMPLTARSLAWGLGGAWLLALITAVPGSLGGSRWYELGVTAFSGLFLCLPSAAVALLVVLAGGPAPLGITLVVFPRLFRHVRNLLVDAAGRPHVLAARAKGLGPTRILAFHLMPVAGARLIALGGVSVSLGVGAAIPMEVICDSPGIGQLVWLAALGRDLPTLIALTLLVSIVTLVANALSDLATTTPEASTA